MKLAPIRCKIRFKINSLNDILRHIEKQRFLKPPTSSTLRAKFEAITICQSQMTNWTRYQYENPPAEGKFGVTLTSRGCTVYEEVIHVVILPEFQTL